MVWRDCTRTSTRSLLLVVCVLSAVLAVAVDCDQVEKRDVHRIILKGARRPRSSYKGHRHHHHHHAHSPKGHGHASSLRDHSYESLGAYDSQSGESGHEHRSRGRPRGHKHHRDSREKYRDRSSERTVPEKVENLQDYKGYKDYRSHENSFEEFHKDQKSLNRIPHQLYNKHRQSSKIHGTRFENWEPFDSRGVEKQHSRPQRHMKYSGGKKNKHSSELDFENDSGIFPNHSTIVNFKDYLDYKQQSSHGHSSEENYKVRPHKFLSTSKKPHYAHHSAEYDESRQEPHNEWKPLHFHEPKPTFRPVQTTHKSKRHRSKKPKPFKGSIELTTSYPQKIPFMVYDNTEYPYVESTFHGFNSKTIDLVNAPALNIESIKTLTQLKTLPQPKDRPSYRVNENTKHDLKLAQQHDGYQILVPDVTRSQFQSSESQVHEQRVKAETSTAEVTTTRRNYQRGRGRYRVRKQNKVSKTQGTTPV